MRACVRECRAQVVRMTASAKDAEAVRLECGWSAIERQSCLSRNPGVLMAAAAVNACITATHSHATASAWSQLVTFRKKWIVTMLNIRMHRVFCGVYREMSYHRSRRAQCYVVLTISLSSRIPASASVSPRWNVNIRTASEIKSIILSLRARDETVWALAILS